MPCQERLALARRTRARRLASTNATASPSVIVLPRFWRCARASAGESLNRTTLPRTMAVTYITLAYGNRLPDTSAAAIHRVRREASFERITRVGPAHPFVTVALRPPRIVARITAAFV